MQCRRADQLRSAAAASAKCRRRRRGGAQLYLEPSSPQGVSEWVEFNAPPDTILVISGDTGTYSFLQ